MTVAPERDVARTSTADRKPRVIAFYLPQFHPTAENDAWWGSGFSEWSNVARARPLFPGHYQPHLPSELGFYDLRVPEVREMQARLAHGHGIEAFCYYHYWFRGQRPLTRVFDEVLQSGLPEFPFCLLWANENWTRTWDAGARQVLMPQDYDAADDEAHIRYLLDAFRDPRYLQVQGRPLLGIYRVQGMPDPRRTLDRWREVCREEGVADPLVCKFETHGNFEDPAKFGCDVAAQFLPHGIGERVPTILTPGCAAGNVVFDYEAIVDAYLDLPQPSWTRFPSVFPGWDNASRRRDGQSLIILHNTPQAYERWITAMAAEVKGEPHDPIIFVNAWNEWAEGAHLEPDDLFGRAFLEATARAVFGSSWTRTPVRPVEETAPAATFAHLYLDLYEQHRGLQRYLTDVLSMMERQIDRAVRDRERELAEARRGTSDIAARADRLQADLSEARRLLEEARRT
jgi:hypothetical protein